MRNRRFQLTVLIVAVLLDFYIFQAIKALSQSLSPRWRLTIYSLYWGISVLAILTILLLPSLQYKYPRTFSYLFTIIIGLYLGKLIAAVFLAIDDLRRAVQWAIQKAGSRRSAGETTGEGISRSAFLSWLGLGLGGSLFSSLIYGFSNKYNYQVRRIQLSFANLPAAFKGLKIVQLSDIHSGSFNNIDAVQKGVDKVLAEKPDLILFTGDLVNNIATEMKDYQSVFRRLEAPMGVYSTLGNHDYGDYFWWETPEHKKANLDHLKQIQADMGWRLLMNEHVALERGGEQIALIGIENWSAKSQFPKYGKLREAYEGTDKYSFKILMSHDPSHWDAEIRPSYSDIDLTLAGHTHGMQWGIDLPWLKWSPVKFVYKQWAGLYEEGKQKLYVNRGFGFIGYPGRFGILPEITVIELA
ncbi:MAG: metallophosphoesterase [Bacteroidetes bacterium]|nr:metallophosphoesterase [Bacteroidota bacterium]